MLDSACYYISYFDVLSTLYLLYQFIIIIITVT